MNFDPAGWTRTTGGLREYSLRQARWCDLFARQNPGAAAATLDFVARSARKDPDALMSYLGFLDLESLVERAGPSNMALALAAARKLHLPAAILILEHPGPRLAPDELGPPPDPVSEKISLGHRKTAARGMRSHLLLRLLKDPDPVVVAEALRNPRLKESEIISIASRRPSGEELFAALARAPQWMARPNVRKTVAMNPYAPPRLAILLMPSLAGNDLSEIMCAESLSPAVREGAGEILAWG